MVLKSANGIFKKLGYFLGKDNIGAYHVRVGDIK
jgi:hypothetical protein